MPQNSFTGNIHKSKSNSMKEAVFLPKIFYTTIYMQNTLLGPSYYLAQRCFMLHFSYPYACEYWYEVVITELSIEHVPTL